MKLLEIPHLALEGFPEADECFFREVLAKGGLSVFPVPDSLGIVLGLWGQQVGFSSHQGLKGLQTLVEVVGDRLPNLSVHIL